jgi:phosphopantetheine adenylyltransferase
VFVPADRDLADVSSNELKRMASADENISRHCHPLVGNALAKLGKSPYIELTLDKSLPG